MAFRQSQTSKSTSPPLQINENETSINFNFQMHNAREIDQNERRSLQLKDRRVAEDSIERR